MRILEKLSKLLAPKKNKVFLIACVVIIGLFFMAVVLKQGHEQDTEMPHFVQAPEMQSGDVYKQELIMPENAVLTEIGLSFEISDEIDNCSPGEVAVAFYKNDALIQKWSMNAMTMDNGWDYFTLDEPMLIDAAASYHVTIGTIYEGEDGTEICQSLSGDIDGDCYLNGEPIHDLAIGYSLVYKDRSSYLLDQFHETVLFGAALLLIVTLFVLLFTRLKKATIFAALAFVIGLFYMITITPLSVPDEPHHYQSSYMLSNILMLQGDTQDYGPSRDFDYTKFKFHDNNPESYLRVLSEFGEEAVDNDNIREIPKPRKLSYFVMYLPQAIGITIGRLLGRNMVTIFLLGRLCNLLFYSGCVFWAIKRLPRFKMPVGIVAILPMALHQASSFSYDAFVNGVALLLIAGIFKLLLTEDKVTWKDLIFIGITAALLAPAKVIYCPILLLLFLVRKERFGAMKHKLLAIGSILLVCAIVIGVFQMTSIMKIGGDGEQELNFENKYTYTVSDILADPLKTVHIFLNSFYDLWYPWLGQAMGSSMSGLRIDIPLWIGAIFMIMIALASCNQKDQSPIVLKTSQRVWITLVSAILIGFVMMSMFLAWTSNTSGIVQGVQGRYFIPVLPLIALLISNRTVVLQRNLDRQLIFLSVALNMVAIEAVLEYTMKNELGAKIL